MVDEDGSSVVWEGEIALGETTEYVWTVTEGAILGVEAGVSVGKRGNF